MKEWFCTMIGGAGAAVTTFFGGFDEGLTTLLIFMSIDFISGIVVAGIFKTSPKTEGGALKSKECLKGIIKKIMMLLLVAVAYRIDIITGNAYIRDMVVIAFIVNDAISILENAGLMGIKLPVALTKAIDILKEQEEK